MSSVDVNAEQVGYTAAALLEDLMSGKKPPAEPILLAPRGVVTRLSSDVVATRDPAVNQAVAFIREHGCGRGIDATAVLAHVRLSRASLEPRMKRVLGRTIHQEIHRVRVERARDLLAHSTMPIKQVAHEAGFSGVQYLTRVFRQATGETPAQYRRARA
jgi:LacI family transcriptional regulator